MDAKSKTLDSIINMYKSQLRKFERLSVRDDDGNFLFGKNTEFGKEGVPEYFGVFDFSH